MGVLATLFIALTIALLVWHIMRARRGRHTSPSEPQETFRNLSTTPKQYGIYIMRCGIWTKNRRKRKEIH